MIVNAINITRVGGIVFYPPLTRPNWKTRKTRFWSRQSILAGGTCPQDTSNSITIFLRFPALTGGRFTTCKRDLSTCDGSVPVYRPTQAGNPKTPTTPRWCNPALNGCAIASSTQAIHHPTSYGTGRRRAAYFLCAKKSKPEKGRPMNRSVRSPPHYFPVPDRQPMREFANWQHDILSV